MRDPVEPGQTVEPLEFGAQPVGPDRAASDHGEAPFPGFDQQELVVGEGAHDPGASRAVRGQALRCRKAVGRTPESVLVGENGEVGADATDHGSSGNDVV